MDLLIAKDSSELDKLASEFLIKRIKEKPTLVIGLATGETPIGTYQNLIKAHKENKISFKKIRTINLDEYWPIEKSHEQSYYSFMHEYLFDSIDIEKENTHILSGVTKDPINECQLFDKLIEKHPIDLQLLGIGTNGHVGFNEPNTPFNSTTHIAKLTEQTRKDNSRFFKSTELVPTHALTMGLGSIIKSKEILLLAKGKHKAKAIFDALKGPISINCPASIIQTHPKVTIIIDKLAGEYLLEQNKCL